ncbi:MAG: carbohydrate-binding family 9-like protein, partial [Lachnospiraceae bacterium]|nr:carbohydrate-binding family 9-like protein [Lachnospiraceae bacterium]
MNQVKIPIPKVAFNPPVYTCKHTDKKFELDGNIFKPFWEDVPFTDDFLDIEGSSMPAPRFKTRAKLAWDDDNLYIAGLLYGNEIWANQKDHDSIIFFDNDFEIFIDPDSDTQQYYEFEMNALNTIWDLLLTKAYRDNGKPVNCMDINGIKTAVCIKGKLNSLEKDNEYWSCEVVMPLVSLCECTPESKKPVAGDYYRLNFSRVQWKVYEENGKITKVKREDGKTPLPEDNWVWAPTGVINIHYPELWGFLYFAKDDESFKIPDDEYVKW